MPAQSQNSRVFPIALLFFIIVSFVRDSDQCAVSSQGSEVQKLACQDCTPSMIKLIQGSDYHVDPTFVLGTGPSGCLNITYTCQGNPVKPDDKTQLSMYNSGADAGIAAHGSSSSATFNCGTEGSWENSNSKISDIDCQVISS